MKTATAQPKGSPASAGSAWDSWSTADLAREIESRMVHFYGQTDGSMRFPSSAEGDILKMVHALLRKPNAAVSEPLAKDSQQQNQLL